MRTSDEIGLEPCLVESLNMEQSASTLPSQRLMAVAYISRYLATSVLPYLAPVITIKPLQFSIANKISQKCAVSTNSSAESDAAAACHIFMLPTEVLCLVRDYLSPSEAVIMSSLCTTLRHHFCCELRYLDCAQHAFAQSSEAWFALQQEKRKATKALDVEHIKTMQRVAGAAGTPSTSVCTGCIRMHEPYMFSEDLQATAPTLERLCLAAQAKVGVCQHINLSLPELRALRMSLMQQRKDSPDGFACQDLCHVCGPANSPTSLAGAPSAQLGYDHLQILQTYHASLPPKFNRHDISGALNSLGVDYVCDHVLIPSPIFTESVDNTPLVALSPNYKHELGFGSCPHCWIQWQLYATASADPAASLQLQLVTTKVLGKLCNPCDQMFVRHTNDAAELVKLVKKQEVADLAAEG